MFTCCPECHTTFRLRAADLRRARGQVRCGDCSAVFNAIEYLVEDPDETIEAPEPTIDQPFIDEECDATVEQPVIEDQPATPQPVEERFDDENGIVFSG